MESRPETPPVVSDLKACANGRRSSMRSCRSNPAPGREPGLLFRCRVGKRQRRSQIPAQGNALGSRLVADSANSERVRKGSFCRTISSTLSWLPTWLVRMQIACELFQSSHCSQNDHDPRALPWAEIGERLSALATFECTMSDKTSILIADDHPVFRYGLRQLIEKDPALSVVGEADDGETALRLIGELKPDI